MGAALTDGERESWNGLIEPFCGSYFAPSRERQLRSSLRAQMRADGFVDLSAYYARAADEPKQSPLWRDLVAQLVNGQTEFFRQPDVVDALRRVLLPEVLGRADGASLCSVGCSTGEEAYTLAMLASELPASVSVVGVDISDDALRHARLGVYRAQRLAGVPVEYRVRFWRDLDGKGTRYQAAAELREMIAFRPYNLAADDPSTLGRHDLILCQNVLIYFRPHVRSRALETLAQALRPGGYLVLGPGEVARPPAGLRGCEFGGLTVFQNIAGRPAR